MQINDEADQKKKKKVDHTQGKRIKKLAKATSGYTEVFSKGLMILYSHI